MYPQLNPWLMNLQTEIDEQTIKYVMPNDVTVFNGLQSFPWNPDEITSFDLHMMFISYYGTRLISPLAQSFVSSSTGKFTTNSVLLLSRMITVRYGNKWDKLWSIYTTDVPLNTVSLTDLDNGSTTAQRVFDTTDTTTHNVTTSHTGTDSTQYGKTSTDSGTDRTTYGKVSTDSGTDTTIYGKVSTDTLGDTTTRTFLGSYADATTGTDTGHVTRSGNQAAAESGTTGESGTHGGTRTTQVTHTGTVADAGTTTGSDSIWGFNSTNAVPSTSNQATDGNTRTFNNTDTSTETPTLTDSSTTTHGKTTTTTYNNVKDETSSQVSSTTTRTYTNHSIADAKTGTDTNRLSGSDSVQHGKAVTQSGTDSYQHGKATALSGTDTKTLNLSDTHTGTETLGKSGDITDSTSYSKSQRKNGYEFRRAVDKEELVTKLFSDPTYADFFDTVFRDIADLLTISVFA